MQDLLSSPIAFYAIIIWSIGWKGIALWNSAIKKQKYWFIAMLVLNTIGTVEIIYYVFFRKDRKKFLFKGKKK